MKKYVCNFFLLLVQYILEQLCFGQFSLLFKNLYLSTLSGWFHGCILTNRVIFWVPSFFCFSVRSFWKMLMPTLGNIILWDRINNPSLLEVTREPKLHKWFWQLHNKVSTKVRVLMFAANHFAWGNGIDLELFRAVWIQSDQSTAAFVWRNTCCWGVWDSFWKKLLTWWVSLELQLFILIKTF